MKRLAPNQSPQSPGLAHRQSRRWASQARRQVSTQAKESKQQREIAAPEVVNLVEGALLSRALVNNEETASRL